MSFLGVDSNNKSYDNMYHYDGLHGSTIAPTNNLYPLVSRDPPGFRTSVWKYQKRPWLAECHETTFLNSVSEQNKHKLPNPFVHLPTNGTFYAKHKGIEGFGQPGSFVHNIVWFLLFYLLTYAFF